MVHDAPVARQKLHRPDRKILFIAQRKDHVAVEVFAVSAQLRGALLLKHEVGRPEILLKGSVVGKRRELGGEGRISCRHVGFYPCPQHRQLLGRRWPGPPQFEVALSLGRRHPPGLDLLDRLLHPIDRVVVGGEREGPDLPRAVAPLTLGMQEGQHIFGVGDHMVCAAGRGRHLRPIERAADRFGGGQRHLPAGEEVEDRVFQFGLRDAR